MKQMKSQRNLHKNMELHPIGAGSAQAAGRCRCFQGCVEHSPSTSLLPEQAQPGSAAGVRCAHPSLNTEGLLGTESMWPQEHIQRPSATSGPPESFQERRQTAGTKKKKTFFTSIPRKVIDTHTDPGRYFSVHRGDRHCSKWCPDSPTALECRTVRN